MRQLSRTSLVQIMSCRLFGAIPLADAELFYCQLDTVGQHSMKLKLLLKTVHSRKCIWKCRWWLAVLDFVQQKKTKYTMEPRCTYACWCHGDLRSHGISRHVIDQIIRNILSLASEGLTMQDKRIPAFYQKISQQFVRSQYCKNNRK